MLYPEEAAASFPRAVFPIRDDVGRRRRRQHARCRFRCSAALKKAEATCWIRAIADAVVLAGR